MSDFQFNCPNCKQAVSCAEELAGTKIKCPICSAECIIPHAPGKATKLGVSAQSARTSDVPIPMAAKAGLVKQESGMPGWVKGLIAAACLGVVGAVLVFTPVIDRVKGMINKEETADNSAPLPIPGGGSSPQQAQAPAQPSPPPAAAPVVPEWTMDVITAKIPTGMVIGSLEGQPFKADSVLLANGILMLREGNNPNPNREFMLYLGRRLGSNLAGKKLQIRPDATNNIPQVIKKWKPDPKYAPRTKSFDEGYALRVEFGQAKEGKIPGKIYLSLPDESQSFVSGTFLAVTPQAAAAAADQSNQPNQPAPQQPTGPAPMDAQMKKRYGL